MENNNLMTQITPVEFYGINKTYFLKEGDTLISSFRFANAGIKYPFKTKKKAIEMRDKINRGFLKI